MLNFEWYRTFKVVYETGTLSGAAQSLFISQPGVSLHLNSLEAYTGFRLFERESRKVVPTDRAVMLYDYLIDALTKLEELEKKLHSKSKVERATVSIGMCFTTFQGILEEHICDLPFNLISRFGECAEILADLESGAIDFVITSERSPNVNLMFVPFATERMILVAGSHTDTTELEKLIVVDNRPEIGSWLSKQRWFATAVDMAKLKQFWQNSFNEAPTFSPDFILPHYSSIIYCLTNGDGFTVIPDYLCSNQLLNKSLKPVWPNMTPIENTLYFGKRKKPVFPGEITILEDILIKHWFKS
jgi:DNA-binding transcriptional LysR family regulator